MAHLSRFVLGDDHRRTLSPQVFQGGEHLAGAGPIQIGGWLVQDQDAGGHGQDCGDGQSLLFAIGEGVHPAASQVFQSRCCQSPFHLSGRLVRGQAQVAGTKGHFLLHPQA